LATALILVDVINDFFHPQGHNYYPQYEAILAHIRRLLDVARRHGVVVIHAAEGHPANHNGDFEWKKLPRHCVIGSFETRPAPGIDIGEGEYAIHKRRYSAFFATDLDLLLRERDVYQLVIVGVKSHVCIRATAQDAFALGYDVIVVKEAVGSNHTHLHEASLEDIERYMGHVVPLEECIALFERSGEGGKRAHGQ